MITPNKNQHDVNFHLPPPTATHRFGCIINSRSIEYAIFKTNNTRKNDVRHPVSWISLCVPIMKARITTNVDFE